MQGTSVPESKWQGACIGGSSRWAQRRCMPVRARMLARAVGALAVDVEFRAVEMESFGQLRGNWRRHVQAKDAATSSASEVHVLLVFDIGLGHREAEYAARVGGLVCQTDFDEPIEDTIEGDPIHFRERFLAQQPFDIAVAKCSMGRLEQAENPDAGGGYARPRRADGGFDGRERGIGTVLHEDIEAHRNR
jgi:hypothetical protein